MENKRFFRILATTLTLVLLLMAIPIVPVSAVVTVTVNPIEGEIGDSIVIHGFGTFNYEYHIYFSSQDADLADEIDDEVTAYHFLVGITAGGPAGSWSATNITVPSMLSDGADDESVHGGIYYIYMTTSVSKIIEAKTAFNVINFTQVTEFTPDEGAVGTEVEISGEGFASGEALIVEYDGDEIDIDSGDEETDSDGNFRLFIIIPESEFGEHAITIIGENSLAELELTFTIEPKINIIPTSGQPGTVITVTGTGFKRYNGVDFRFGGTAVTSVVWLVQSGGRTSSNGSFTVNLTVPDFATGSYVILAEDEDDFNIFDAAFFTIEPTITPTPTTTVIQTTTITTTATIGPNTVTKTVTAEPNTVTTPTTITATVTNEPNTTTISTTITKTVTAEPTNAPASEGSKFNIWIPIAAVFGVLTMLLIGFIIYAVRSNY